MYLHVALLIVNNKNARSIKNSHRVDPVAVKTDPFQPALFALLAPHVADTVHQFDQG